jgi:hypothetical protein
MDAKRKEPLLVVLSPSVIRVFTSLVLKSPRATLRVVLYFGVESMKRITIKKVKFNTLLSLKLLIIHLIDTYVNIFNCDGCSKKLVEESWFTCVPCASSYFSSFDLCTEVKKKKKRKPPIKNTFGTYFFSIVL